MGKVDFLAKDNPQPFEMFYDLSHVQGDFVTYVTTPQQSGSVTRHINSRALIQERIPYHTSKHFVYWVTFACFFVVSLLIFFQIQLSKISFRNTIRVSTGLDPKCRAGSDLGPNCLQKLSADDTSKQNFNPYHASTRCFLFLKQCRSRSADCICSHRHII